MSFTFQLCIFGWLSCPGGGCIAFEMDDGGNIWNAVKGPSSKTGHDMVNFRNPNRIAPFIGTIHSGHARKDHQEHFWRRKIMMILLTMCRRHPVSKSTISSKGASIYLMIIQVAFYLFGTLLGFDFICGLTMDANQILP